MDRVHFFRTIRIVKQWLISIFFLSAVQLNLIYVFVNLKLWVFLILGDKASIADKAMRVVVDRGNFTRFEEGTDEPNGVVGLESENGK